jgi:hypothetical protein
MGRACSVYGREEGCLQGLVRNREGKILLESLWRRWEYNFKMYFKEVGCGGMGWIDLARDRDR